jgi:dienelactone hydrolase
MGFELDLRDRAMWPDREELSIEFTRLLGAAQEGGATVAECVVAASRVDSTDDQSWFREWTRLADASCARADDARGEGHLLTARSNWLRAINYYQSAAFPFDREHANHQLAVERMRQCARDYLEHRNPRGEVVSIPWPNGYPLEAYFLPATPALGKPAPAIVCMGEPGQRKEEYLSKVARFAADRGMSLLAVDLLGAGPRTEAELDEVLGRSDLETTVGLVMDYLVERDDVDRDRIAILADGWGSSFVARGIAFDDRFAAAVCDGGIWDLHERAFLIDRDAELEAGAVRQLGLARVARNIQCPVLISTGERGWLKAERVRELYDHLRNDGRDVTLKIFTSGETAAAQGHADNPTLANEYIFDWVAARLGIAAR